MNNDRRLDELINKTSTRPNTCFAWYYYMSVINTISIFTFFISWLSSILVYCATPRYGKRHIQQIWSNISIHLECLSPTTPELRYFYQIVTISVCRVIILCWFATYKQHLSHSYQNTDYSTFKWNKIFSPLSSSARITIAMMSIKWV